MIRRGGRGEGGKGGREGRKWVGRWWWWLGFASYLKAHVEDVRRKKENTQAGWLQQARALAELVLRCLKALLHPVQSCCKKERKKKIKRFLSE